MTTHTNTDSFTSQYKTNRDASGRSGYYSNAEMVGLAYCQTLDALAELDRERATLLAEQSTYVVEEMFDAFV